MNDPLPRWVPLPGDPPALKRRLAVQQAETDPERALPEDWPEEAR